jgi:hypothetical protein
VRNMTGLYNVLSHPRLEGKTAWETVKILFSTTLYPLIYTTNASFTEVSALVDGTTCNLAGPGENRKK